LSANVVRVEGAAEAAGANAARGTNIIPANTAERASELRLDDVARDLCAGIIGLPDPPFYGARYLGGLGSGCKLGMNVSPRWAVWLCSGLEFETHVGPKNSNVLWPGGALVGSMASMKTKGTVEDYLKDVSAGNANTFRAVRALIKKEAPGLTEVIKWGNPVYVGKENVIMICSYNNHLNVEFVKGAHMKDPKNELEGTGKGLRHVKIPHGEKVPEAVIKAFIKQGLALDGK